ncbi:MAG: hypothetical protein OJF62_000075 [Pseudolabrys sp.]|nr:hypothetical protein [Pseudolabrys sp.]
MVTHASVIRTAVVHVLEAPGKSPDARRDGEALILRSLSI